jgi:hypothetical protein
MAIIYAFIGLFIGVIVWLVGRMGGFAGSDSMFASGYGVGAIVVLPIVYGGIGFVGMLIITSLYNWAAGLVGGIEIQTGEEASVGL